MSALPDSTATRGGSIPNYRSGLERTVVANLKRRGHEFSYETLKLPYVIPHVYNPDLIFPNGLIVEIKGRFMKGDAAKMIAVKKAHPHLDIRFLFSNAEAKIPGQKGTYAQWCLKHGFQFCSETIPEDWLK